MNTINRYMIFADHRFGRLAAREFKLAYDDSTIEHYTRIIDFSLYLAGLDRPAGEVVPLIKEARFIDFVLPVDAILEDVQDIQSVYDKLVEIFGGSRDKSIKLEIKKWRSALEGNAKSLEVLLGNKLEHDGFTADLVAPDIIVYVVLITKTAIIGHIDRQAGAPVLDAFRQQNKQLDPFNRAEFKIKEAVEFFGLDIGEIKRVLDIGAAPGGWTHFFVEHGSKVVAIDSGSLDVDGFNNRQIVVTEQHDRPTQLELDRSDIVHVKANFSMLDDAGISMISRMGPYDLIAIDINGEPPVSASIANSVAGMIKRDGHLIMTIKLVTPAVQQHIDTVLQQLANNYRMLRIKKLPHNRRELTLFGIRS